MLHKFYRAALRLPDVRGKGRLTEALRRQMAATVTDVGGVRMQLDPMEWAQIDILANGGLEPKTAALFARLLRQGDTYIDVGAHVGYHALIARRRVGGNGRVLAIEPQPYNANRILVNAALNGFSNITTVVAAVGDRDGIVTLHDQVATDKSRLTVCDRGVSDGIAEFEVPIYSLDSLLARHGVDIVRLLKVDVEGYELTVFRGATGILPIVENVIFEVLADSPSAQTVQLTELFSSQGFSLATVEGKPWVQGCDLPESNVWARRLEPVIG